MESPLKACSKCKIEKNLEEFSRNRTKKDGHSSYCRECQKTYRHDKAKKQAYDRAYYQENRDRILARKQSHRQENKAASLLYYTRIRSQKKNLDFNLTFEWIQERLDRGCELTGREFDLKHSKEYRHNPFGPSIDRIDSSKAYTRDNCQIVCLFVNLAKSEWNSRDFREICMELSAVANQPKPRFINGAGI